MSDQTKWAIKNGQSRNTGNISHKTKNVEKQNKKNKKMSNTDPPPPKKKPGVNPGAREGKQLLLKITLFLFCKKKMSCKEY